MTQALGKADLIKKNKQVDGNFCGGTKGNIGSFRKPFKIEVALGFVTSNLTSKPVDTDTSPALIRAVFGFRKNIVFTQKQQQNCLRPQSKASESILFSPFLLLSGFLRKSLFRVLKFSAFT